MSAYINAAATDANEILSGFRATLPTLSDLVEATIVLSAAALMTGLLNSLL